MKHPSTTRLGLVWFALLLIGFAFGCGKDEGPLPGDMSGVPLDRATSSPQTAPGTIGSRLFPPDLIMEHQAELGIDPAQRELILKEVERGQAELLRMQWDLQSEKDKLAKVLEAPKVDEAKAAEAAHQVLAMEDRVKMAHLMMLVRVRNVLTSAQQEKLRATRK